MILKKATTFFVSAAIIAGIGFGKIQASIYNYYGAPGVIDQTSTDPTSTSTINSAPNPPIPAPTPAPTTAIQPVTKEDILQKLNLILTRGRVISKEDKNSLLDLLNRYLTGVVLPTVETAIIGPGESAEVQCGEGNDGVNPQLDEENSNIKYTLAGGELRNMTVYTLDQNFKRANGARLKWTFAEWAFGGSLAIEGCSAVFTPPDTIRTAGYLGANIHITVVSPQAAAQETTMGGEGGPRMPGYVFKKSILVYNPAYGGSSCQNPAGVSVSAYVLSGFNVRIRIAGPRGTKSFNQRVVTLRDGPGYYRVSFFLNNILRAQRETSVKTCQLIPVKADLQYGPL